MFQIIYFKKAYILKHLMTEEIEQTENYEFNLY